MLQRLKMCVAVNVLAFAALHCSKSTDQTASASPPPPPAEDPSAQPTIRGPGAPANSEIVESEQKPPVVTGNEAARASDTAPKATTDLPETKPLTDEQIAAITDGANSAEINQAMVARNKSKNSSVQRFAQMMIAHHGDAQKKQAKLKLKTSESSISQNMLEDNNKTLASLKDKSGADFDRAYIQAQVEGHRKVLDTINNELLPNVKNPDLKAYIQEIKPKVEQHLQLAQETEQQLMNGKSGVGASTGTSTTPGSSGMNSSNKSSTSAGTSGSAASGSSSSGARGSSGTGTGTGTSAK